MASSKNDNQASFGSKRHRNGVLQKDGDWICTTCGNLNFSFRIVCNKKYCHAPKPSGSSAPKPFAAPVKALATEIMRPNNGGDVTLPPPPPMYGIPINFGSIPSCIPYGSYGTMAPRIYGPGTSTQATSFGAIPSIPSPSLGGILVNSRSDINPYGYGFQGPSPWDAGLTIKNYESYNDSKFHKDSKSHKDSEVSKDSKSHRDSESHKRRTQEPNGLSEGDWVCPRCENVNFAFRSKCNMKKCRVGRPTPMALPVFPEGRWSCKKYGNMNYPYRNTCNMKGCGVERPSN